MVPGLSESLLHNSSQELDQLRLSIVLKISLVGREPVPATMVTQVILKMYKCAVEILCVP